MSISKSLIKTIVKVAVVLNSCVVSGSLAAPVGAYTYQMSMTNAHNKLSEINRELISHCGASGEPIQTPNGYSIPCVDGSSYLVSYNDANLLANVLRAPFTTLINFIGDYLIASDPNQQVNLPDYATNAAAPSGSTNYSFSLGNTYQNSATAYGNPITHYVPDNAAPPVGYGGVGSYQNY